MSLVVIHHSKSGMSISEIVRLNFQSGLADVHPCGSPEDREQIYQQVIKDMYVLGHLAAVAEWIFENIPKEIVERWKSERPNDYRNRVVVISPYERAWVSGRIEDAAEQVYEIVTEEIWNKWKVMLRSPEWSQ